VPKKVDHHQRRTEIARVVRELVRDVGVESLTIRNVAESAGFSTSIVVHYFDSKRDMLIFAQQESRRRAESAVRAARAAGGGLEDCVAIILPCSEEMKSDWHLFFAFWGMAMYDEELAEERRDGVADAQAIFAELVVEAQQQGLFDPNADPEMVATSVQIFANGMAALAMQGMQAWPADRQRHFLHEELRRLGYRG